MSCQPKNQSNPKMDPRLREAAKTGKLEDLYALIHEDPYILEPIDLLMGWLHNSINGSPSWRGKILNWKDNEENTLLHIAAKKSQHKVYIHSPFSLFISILINQFLFLCNYARTKTIVKLQIR